MPCRSARSKWCERWLPVLPWSLEFGVFCLDSQLLINREARLCFLPTKPLVLRRAMRHYRRMPEIVQFVHRGAAQITSRIVRGVHKKLPFLKMSFTQIQAPNYP